MSALALPDLVPSRHTLAGLRRQVQAGAPKRPGVYEFLDPVGAVIYVGKAKDLRTRLLSYFTAPWPESKSARLIRCAATLRWNEQPSEFAALLEEHRRITRLRPAYNVRGARQRASLAFVKVTRGPAPKLTVSDRASDPRAFYYGPFYGRGRTADAVRTLSDLLGLRDCAERVPMAFADQPGLFGVAAAPLCIRHELGTCLGPCAARVDAGRYSQAVDAAIAFLEGRSAHPLDRVLEAMADASEARAYERAALWRTKLDELTGLFAAVARLRAAAEGLSFVYTVRDPTGNGADRVYAVHQGLVRAEAAWPRTPLERLAFAESVRRCMAPTGPAPIARSGAEMLELLLVMSWFRQHPEEYEQTTRWQRWLDD